MSDLNSLVDDYMSFRQSRGYQPSPKIKRMLHQFVDALPAPCDGLLFSIFDALAWANAGGRPAWNAARLSMVRGFASYLVGCGLKAQIPPAGQMAAGTRRATPYLYSPADVTAIMGAANVLFSPLKAATMATLTGLLAVTGMRIGEALSLTVGSIDWTEHTITILRAKFGTQRVVVLHESTCQALTAYLNRPDRASLGTETHQPLLTAWRGIAMSYSTAGPAFHEMVIKAGLPTRPGARPRAHDLRHTFATQSMIDAYVNGGDPARTLALLSVWLGHVNPADTFWYLQAAPEVAAIAASTLDNLENGTVA